MWRLVKSVALVRCRWLRASSCFFSFSNDGNGPKGALTVKVTRWWARVSRAILAEAGYFDCGYEMRGLHHLFIVGNHAVFRIRVCWLGFQLFRVFSSFSSLFYIFYSFLEIFSFLEEFWIFLEEKRVLWPFGGILSLLEAFCMVLWVFDGNMVGKWTNEPCNGADEAVNHF